MKRTSYIIGAAVVCVIAFIVHFATRTPPGVEVMGDESETVAWVSLATAVLSLIATIVGLVQKAMELRHASAGRR